MPIPPGRNRDFLLLWTGQVVSTIGTRVSGLAYPLIVLAITGSAAQDGLVAAAQTAASPPARPGAVMMARSQIRPEASMRAIP